jgi:hypothetical protein
MAAPISTTWAGEEKAEAIRIILDRMTHGQALRDICKDPELPGYSTVNRWLDEDEELKEMYARAREKRADWLADELVEIADTETDSAKARNRIDARKWAAAKLNPKRYADRTDSTTTHEAGAGMGALLAQLSAGSVFPTKKNDDESKA